LRKAQENYSWFSPEGVAKMVIGEIEEDQRFRVEYASVVDADTLNSFDDWDDVQHAVICVAVYLGQVRLIDNIRLF
jgi:pantoate--beta-alanine ligase